MKFGSLFSGIGGFDLGFERAGMTCAFQCEIDKHASAVLTTHWPNVRREKDVRHIGKHNLESVDLICGGFPCQDLSVAGNRAGLAGGRSGLWWEFHRVLSELLPRWVVIENVPGLLSSDKGRDMGLLLGALAQLGYGWAYRVLDAQYFGVAQRRRRVFIVGYLGDWSRAAQVLFEPESLRRDSPPRREAGQSFAFSAGQGAKAGSIGWGNEITPTLKGASSGSNQVPVAFQQNVRDEVRLMNGDGQIAGALSSQAGMKQQNYVAYNTFGGNKRKDRPEGGFYVEEDPPAAKTLDSSGTGPSSAQGGVLVAFGGNNTRGEIAVSTAINAHPSRRYDFESETFVLQPGVRRLTPTECERLQGFPDGWTAGQADTSRYRQLGNAVAVPVLEWLGRRLITQSF